MASIIGIPSSPVLKVVSENFTLVSIFSGGNSENKVSDIKQTSWTVCCQSYPIRRPVWDACLRVFSCIGPYWALSLLTWKTKTKWWSYRLTSETLSFRSIRWENLSNSPSVWEVVLTFRHFLWRSSMSLAVAETGPRRGWGAAHANPCELKSTRLLWGAGGSTPDSSAAPVLWARRRPLP